jgi:hypothetical protein
MVFKENSGATIASLVLSALFFFFPVNLLFNSCIKVSRTQNKETYLEAREHFLIVYNQITFFFIFKKNNKKKRTMLV